MDRTRPWKGGWGGGGSSCTQGLKSMKIRRGGFGGPAREVLLKQFHVHERVGRGEPHLFKRYLTQEFKGEGGLPRIL